MSSGSLQAFGLAVRYGEVPALDDVALDVPAGRFLAVTGPSGAGKSSLLWTLGGALEPAHGEVLVDGERIRDRVQAAGLGVTLMPQGNALLSSLTALENVFLPLVTAGAEPREARERARSALGLLGLEESRGHLIEELSGGQQQRVAVARALAARARVMLLDEPTSDLDATTRELVLAALRAEAGSGAIVVMATHDPEAAALADAELALEEGTVAGWRPGR